MTVLTLPAPAAPAPPSVPWRRMAWVTWRQHRPTLVSVPALLAAVALFLLITGLKSHHDYAAMTACRPAGSATCQDLGNAFSNTDWHIANVVLILLNFAPALIGAFAGGPVLARELETGTFRFAWTQGCGRMRWVVTKLALLGIAVTVAAQAFSLLFSWYFQPWFAEGLDGSLAPQLFDLRGIDFAAWTLLAFALGVAAGALIKRTVSAMGAAMAIFTGLFFATFTFLREHYQAPLVAGAAKASTVSFGLDWNWARWWTGPNGKPVSQQTINGVLQHARLAGQYGKSPDGATAYLAAHHYAERWLYQPQSRYWHFQLIEGGWLVALSLILLAGAVWLVRAKAA